MPKNRRAFSFFSGMRQGALALTLTSLSTFASAQILPSPGAADGTRLELQARGVVRVAPDRAVISAGVLTQAAVANEAMRANADQMGRIRKALQIAGVAEKDVQTETVSLTPQYRYAANEAPVITGYQASNMLRISLTDIARAGGVIDALVKQGANDVNGPSFIISAREPAENQARQEALRLIQAHAALYAKTMGLQVRRVVSLSESVENAVMPMPVASMRVFAADGASAKTSLSGGEQEVAVTLSAVVDLGPRP